MNILRRISVIALCGSFFFHSIDGQATCSLSWENGTVLPDSNWNFGYILNSIEDVTAPETVLIDMIASSITSISSIVVDSNSGYTFMQPTLTDGRFTLTLTDYFTRYEELETSTTILVTVTFVCSVNTRSLEIYQPIIDTNNHYPEFQNSPYIYELPMPFPSGFSVQLFGTISARDIDLTNTNISFTLNSSDINSAGFTASWLSQDTVDTKLHYAQLLTTALLNIENDITFNLYATDNGVPSLTSVTNITISVDEENSVPTSPIFKYPLYIADHSDITDEQANGTLIVFNQGNVSFSQGANSYVEYTIVDNIGDYANNFLITISEDYTSISISLQNVTPELLAEKYVILTLTATRLGAENPGITILHMVFPGIICPEQTTTQSSIVTTAEQTTTSWTESTNVTSPTTTACECPEVIECTTVTTESITVTECPTVTTTECPVVTECPILTTEECVCDCTTATTASTISSSGTTVPTEETTECPVVTVTQECDCDETTSPWVSTTTTPSTENDGPPITTTSTQNDTMITTANPSTENDSSIITTTTAITPSLSFPNSVYIFEKESTFTGVLMTQTAEASNTDEEIVYSTSFDDDYLASRILINANTAELQVTATIDPGTHTFQIIATIEELNINASATVVLVISALTECNDKTVFGYALQIIELEEESPHENVLPFDNDNGCSYTIYSQTPSQDLFYISDDNRLNTIAIDREASYFNNMNVAQVRLIIDVNCSNVTNDSTIINRTKRDTVYEILTDNIPYILTRTILVAIITDINDNAPILNSDTPNYIGFPGYNLAQLIHVPYIYKFSATDADIDDNAIVIYSLSSGSDEYFYIHNSTGRLYVRQGIHVDDYSEITLNVTDGKFDTPKNVIVKTLESEYIAVLFINGGVIEDVNNILEDLNESTGYWIQSIDSAVISEIDVSSSHSDGYRFSKSILQRTEVSTNLRPTLLRLVIYGFDNDQLLSSQNLVSTLKDSSISWEIFELVTFESILSTSEETATVDSTDTRGLWAAIIVLLIILIALLISAGVLYYLFGRRSKPTSVESNVTYENFDNRRQNGNPANFLVKSVTLGESQDHVTSPQTTKRKSVAFNNTVEEIEVARL